MSFLSVSTSLKHVLGAIWGDSDSVLQSRGKKGGMKNAGQKI